MRRILTVLFLAGLLVAPVAPAHADDSYAPSIPTSCHIGAPTIKVGQRVVLTIEVSSNSSSPEVGSVKLAISTAATRTATRSAARVAARGVVWTKTVRYAGTPLEVRGPKLPRGSYVVSMAFTPDGGELVGCRNSAAFRVGAGGDVGGEDDDNGSGGLPNTGGPHLWILLAGLALVVGGGALAGGSRRQGATA